MFKSWRQKLGYFSLFTALPAVLTLLGQEARAEEAKNLKCLSPDRTRGFLSGLKQILAIEAAYLP
jgi:hypothetical protein